MVMAVKRLHDARTTAQLILDQITEYPETHDQDDFEDVSEFRNCATKRCVAGWAVHFNGYKVTNVVNFDTYDAVADLGRQLLGLDQDEAEWLFYRASNETAAEAVRQLAAGEKVTIPGKTNDYF